MGTARKPQPITPAELRYREVIWNLLIAYGGAITPDKSRGNVDVDFYGSCLNIDADKSTDVAQRIASGATVDYQASSDPAEETGRGFAGTECDYDTQVHYLVGELVLSDGHRVRWGARTPDSVGFGGLIRLLAAGPLAFADASERLTERATGADSYIFKFGCEIGRKW